MNWTVEIADEFAPEFHVLRKVDERFERHLATLA